MTGRNPQLDRGLSLDSIRFSRHLSLARAHFENGNAILGEILIGELMAGPAGRRSSLFRALTYALAASVQELCNAQAALSRLRSQMQTEGFADPPTLGRIDLSAIGMQLQRENMIASGAWKHALTLIEHGGFYEVTEYLEVRLVDIVSSGRFLCEKFRKLEPAILQGALSPIAEKNLPGNFQVECATLYTQWDHFDGLLLASSLIMTELRYALDGKPSLASHANHVWTD